MFDGSNVLVLIEARRNSRRLPTKHLLDICGKPLIERVIDSCIDSGVGHVAISTDCPDCKAIAADLGVPNVEREPWMYDEDSDPHVWQAAMWKMCREYWASIGGVEPFKLLELNGNSLLFQVKTLQDQVAALDKPNTQYVRSTYRADDDHPYYAMTMDDDGAMAFMHPEVMTMCSQDHPDAYIIDHGPVGQWMPLRDGNIRAVVNKKHDVVHVHTHEDYQFARDLWSARKGKVRVGEVVCVNA